MTTITHPMLAVMALSAALPGPVSAADSEAGTVSGVIRFEGEIPELPPLVRKGTELRLGETVAADIPDRSLVVDGETRGLANVFVYLAEQPAGAGGESATPPTVLEIRNFEYVPRAAVVRTGSTVRVENHDRGTYNIRTRPARNVPFNYVVGHNGQVSKVLYQHPEPFPLPVRGDLHPWMLAWHLPLDHSFAAVTDEQGRFTIEGLPPGEHRLTLWHERAGYLAKALAVEVREGETTEIEQQFPSKDFDKPPPRR